MKARGKNTVYALTLLMIVYLLLPTCMAYAANPVVQQKQSTPATGPAQPSAPKAPAFNPNAPPQGTITITTPTSGATWYTGSYQQIQWSCNNTRTDLVEVTLWKDGKQVDMIWPESGTGRTAYIVRPVRDAEGQATERYEIRATSTSDRRIEARQPVVIALTTLTVSTPAAVLATGSVYTVAWSYTGAMAAVKLAVLDSSGAVVQQIPDIPAGSNGQGHWSWKVLTSPTGKSYAQYRFQISAAFRTSVTSSAVADKILSTSDLFTVAGGPLPDLIITDIVQDPPNPIPNQSWRFLVTLKNQGTANAFFPKGTKYMANKEGNSWNGITWDSDITIPPGGTFTGLKYVGVNATGNYTITFKADPDNTIVESSKNNNEKTINYSIAAAGLPDLIIESISLASPQPTVEGFNLNVVVKNIGSGAVSLSNLVIIRTVGSDNIEKVGDLHLMPGASTNFVCSAVRLMPGPATWTLIVDPLNKVSESDKSNNTKTIALNIAGQNDARPDLIVTEIALDPPAPRYTDSWRFLVKIKNQGKISAFFPTGTNYMALKEGNSWNGQTLGSDITIPPGGTFEGVKYHNYPSAGNYNATFKADPDNVVIESDKTNNEKTFSFTLKP